MLKCLLDSIDGIEFSECKICDLDKINEAEHDETTNDTRLLYENLFKHIATRGLKVFQQNVNDFFSEIDALKTFQKRTKKCIHILGITESHLNSIHVDEQFIIEGYAMMRRNRASNQGGGVCAYIRDDMNWELEDDLEHKDMEGVWIKLFIKKSKSLLIGFIYRPPDSC